MSGCTPGHREACWSAKGPATECSCACGGDNHGIWSTHQIEAQKELFGMMAKLTPWSEFQAVYDEATGLPVSTRHFLPGVAVIPDVRLWLQPNLYGGDDFCTNVPRKFVYHSPTGIAWGYSGSGPADLALDILGMVVPPPEAWRLHHEFKAEFLAPLDMKQGHVIRAEVVIEWVRNQWAKEREEQKLQGGVA